MTYPGGRRPPQTDNPSLDFATEVAVSAAAVLAATEAVHIAAEVANCFLQ